MVLTVEWRTSPESHQLCSLLVCRYLGCDPLSPTRKAVVHLTAAGASRDFSALAFIFVVLKIVLYARWCPQVTGNQCFRRKLDRISRSRRYPKQACEWVPAGFRPVPGAHSFWIGKNCQMTLHEIQMKERLMERNKNPPPFSLEGPGREVQQLQNMALGVAMVVCLLFKGKSFPFLFFFSLTVTLKNVKI